MWIGRKEEDTEDYYLAGKTVAWWAIAGSIFGTNISSHHMVGMMGAGLKEGFAQANFEFGAIFGLMMLCYFFLPFYRRMGIYTLSEYLGRRFDERSQLVYSITNMAFLLIQMVATMMLGALTIAKLTRWPRQVHPAHVRAARRKVAELPVVGRAIDRMHSQQVLQTATLGQHTNDRMISFYMRTPSNFDIEFGCGGTVVDWREHIVHEFTRVSLWGHDFSVGNQTRT